MVYPRYMSEQRMLKQLWRNQGHYLPG